MVRALVTYARDEGVCTVAEGVECQEDAKVCADLGFDLAQGFFFGKPLSFSESRTRTRDLSSPAKGKARAGHEKG
jgi:EAL domain-containing protein (putative c-di-GMP-specific phosphodiesterase class I)